ncbi:hypothetical protein [Methylobacterium sp. Leaf117]|uniref:hypothetical protein n=1 Tax=Methylobacterium sp. Leaf117 TaxID=1736260 RepID=UPI00072BE12F|nr:hypothetical protein [Methylobacterium sp. Leaf117]KQP82849.1 hypothetical protein ASF57_11985 [Methylobacterium sp. Leaf117]
MAENGIRTSNVPLRPLIEVLGHSDAGGGARALARMAIGDFVNAVLGLANGDESAVASLQGQITSAMNAIGILSQQIAAAAQADDAQSRNLISLIDARASQDEVDILIQQIAFLARDKAPQRQVDILIQQVALAAEQVSIEILEQLLSIANSDRVKGDAATLLAILRGDQPGVSPIAFSATAIGSTEDAPALNANGRVSTALGAAYQITGAGLIAPRGTIAVDPDAIWILRARYWRLADVLDPNNNAVDLGIQWLDASDRDAGQTLIRRETNLLRQDGPRLLTIRVPSLVGDAPAIVPPKGAVSWRPYLRTYGADGATAIGLLGASNATFAGVYAPDVSALAARMGTIEGKIAAGLPFATPILPAFSVADLPKAGTPGRKAFARDGRAPSAAGVLEAANAGTGVEVIDNGSKWVISGTNQAVQA